ncbi:MAG: FAD:protein FMN transferase [Ottowia sp.]|nr:FAD:protein FMN transferase [Ottowia sp.]
MKPSPNRRRFIGIVAAGSAAALLPLALRPAQAGRLPDVTSWRGIALGADAQLQIHHPDRAWAEQLVLRAVTEVRRLEQVFSLYRNDSALVRLNRAGRLDAAPGDLLRLLQESRQLSALTQGAFDPSVQVLWDLYADAARRGQALPRAEQVAEALKQVDWRAIEVTGRSVRLARPGMALTLNGIAQGYITDRVTELLRDAGLEHALVDMGEVRGLALDAGLAPWRVGLADDSEARRPLKTLQIRNQAVSTSSGRGTLLDTTGAVTHIFDPRSGRADARYRSVSVQAANATTADALSTALYVMDSTGMRRVLAASGASAWLLRNGSRRFEAVA